MIALAIVDAAIPNILARVLSKSRYWS